MLIKKRKILEKDLATSIMISTELMKKCEELSLLITNRENEYYHVKGTNKVIAHIEEDFCCLVDYKVTTVNSPEALKSLPHMLSANHYAVYQKRNKFGASRDWIECSADNTKIGYTIKFIIHGEGCRLYGQTMDHGAETWNELDANIQFKYGNINEGSHKRPKFINTMEELLEFINVIREYEKNGGTGFVYKDK